jgi:Mitochondrial carrier protein
VLPDQVCCLTNPIWVVKTRLELQHSSALGAALKPALPRYRGMLDAVAQIAKEEGVRGFYRGLVPSLFLVRAPDMWILFMAAKQGRNVVRILHSKEDQVYLIGFGDD